MNKQASELISALEEGGFVATCNSCGEQFKLKNAGLFYLGEFTPEAEEKYKQMLIEQKERRTDLQKEKKKIPERSEKAAVASNIGKTLEKVAPILPSFNFKKNDCRAMFDPIDYIIFEGLSEKGEVQRIIFVDVKTGRGTLNSRQKSIKAQIEKKRVEFLPYTKEGAK